MGVSEIPRRIFQAEEYSPTRSDDVVVKDVSKAGRILRVSTAEEADVYLKDLEQLKTYTQTLNRDPSGFELIDRIITDVEEELENNPAPLTIREFHIEWAKTGALIYKALYPKAQKILQQ